MQVKNIASWEDLSWMPSLTLNADPVSQLGQSQVKKHSQAQNRNNINTVINTLC